MVFYGHLYESSFSQPSSASNFVTKLRQLEHFSGKCGVGELLTCLTGGTSSGSADPFEGGRGPKSHYLPGTEPHIFGIVSDGETKSIFFNYPSCFVEIQLSNYTRDIETQLLNFR